MSTLLKNRVNDLGFLLKKELGMTCNNGLYSLYIVNNDSTQEFLFDGTEDVLLKQVRAMIAGYRFGIASVNGDSDVA